MKHYKNALLALKSSATPTAKQNKFTKISLETSDEVLKELTGRVAKMYSYHLKSGHSRLVAESHPMRGMIPTNWREWGAMQKAVNSELLEYINLCLANNKPEWMVMAEKHGWTPPRH